MNIIDLENVWKENLENKGQKYKSFYSHLINKFWKFDSINNEYKKSKASSNVEFGNFFEKMVAYVLGDFKISGLKLITKSEFGDINGGNNGIDIIFPHINDVSKDYEIWVIQVKTGKNRNKDIAHKVANLEKRANKLFGDIQDSNCNYKTLVKRFKINSNLAKKLKKYKDKFKLRTMWVTEISIENQPSNNPTTTYETLETLIKKKAIYESSYHLSSLMNKERFEINTDFSNTKEKAITIGDDNKNIDTLISSVKISRLLSMMKKINEKKYTIDGLFGSNVRDNKGKNEISNEILKTLMSKNPNEDFFKMNNGITLITNNITFEDHNKRSMFTLEGLNVVNGQQTLRVLWNNYDQLKDCEKYILLKAYKKINDKQTRLITSASNRQTAISSSEIVSTYKFNKMLQKELLKDGIFYKYRTGTTDFSKQFKKLPSISLKNILKYITIKETANVWIKNNMKKVMNEIAGTGKESSISQLIKDNDDDIIVEKLKEIALIIKDVEIFKPKLKLSQSFDMFSYFYMQNSTKAKQFIDKFNNLNEDFVEKKRENKQIPGDNIANLYKSKKNSEDFFKKIKITFDNWR